MKQSFFIGGTSTGTAYKGDSRWATFRSITEQTIDLTNQVEEVLGQKGTLIGRFYHTSRMAVTLTEQVFDLKYVQANVGSAIKIGTSAQTTESVKLQDGGAGSVTDTPVPFEQFGTIGWATDPKTGEEQKVTFNQKNFTFVGGEEGQEVCVTYTKEYANGEEIDIPAQFVPETLHLVLTGDLYAAYGTSFDVEQSTVVGKVIIDIPQYVLDGNQTITMTNTGVSNSPLNGSAKANLDATCEGNMVYATIKVILNSANWYDNIERLALIPAGSVTLEKNEKVQIDTWAVAQGYQPYHAVDGLAYATSKESFVTVSPTGEISAVNEGTSEITVSIKNKPSVKASITVTVTA